VASKVDPKTMVSPNELIVSRVVSSEATVRLLVKKGIIAKEEFIEMVEEVNLEMARMV